MPGRTKISSTGQRLECTLNQTVLDIFPVLCRAADVTEPQCDFEDSITVA